MATERYFKCVQCHKRTYPHHLFEALRDISGAGRKCKGCGGTEELHLVFDFGLEVGNAACRVLHAFLPRDLARWQTDDGKLVTFFPFLVVMERTDKEGQSFWLPYWHTIEGTGTIARKYGQWAPFMDGALFRSLVAQAREVGYFHE